MALRRSASMASRRAFLPMRGGAGGPPPAPFVRVPPPRRPLNEEHELIWDDGVAPETAIDFEAPHVSSRTALKWWFSGFGFFAALGGFLYFWDAPGRKRTVTRQLPFNNLAVELGADPNAEE